MLKKEAPKSKGRRKPGKSTITTLDHVQGAPDRKGHEDRLRAYIKRSLELSRKGEPLYSIAEIIADEYKLTAVPHIITVHRWIKQGREAIDEDIKELAYDLRITQFNELERLKAKWMHIATAEEIEIKRWRMVEGSLQPTLDENAIKEQLGATEAIVKIMARQAKLMNLDLQEAKAALGDGPSSIIEIQQWITNRISYGEPGVKTLSGGQEVLELKSGLEEGDAL